jgi:hypothetical protein
LLSWVRVHCESCLYCKEPAFCFIDSLYFLVSISLIPVLIFVISLFLLVLGLACSCYSKSWKCSTRSFIWGLPVFSIYVFMAKNILLFCLQALKFCLPLVPVYFSGFQLYYFT